MSVETLAQTVCMHLGETGVHEWHAAGYGRVACDRCGRVLDLTGAP